MTANSRVDVDRFLASGRIAVIGVSRNRAHFSRVVSRALTERGYDVVPVHPGIEEIEGVKCFGSIAEVSPAPHAALIMLPRGAAAESAAAACADAGIGCLWSRQPINVAPLRARGVAVVSGECPLMYLPHARGVHWLHGVVRHVMGTYPA